MTARTRLAMALRCMCLQATWNYERQQGLGFAWALQPALERLVADRAARLERLAAHTAYFNTQPTLASLAVGATAALEARRAAGEADDASLARVKAALGSSLAALGDRLFWFTLRPVAALGGLLLAVDGRWEGALVLVACYNGLHLGVRVLGVGWGWRRGPAVLDEAFRRRVERLVRGLAVLGCAAVGVLVAMLLVPVAGMRPVVFQAALAAGLGVGFVTAQRARPSPTEWALGVGTLCVLATWFR
uniref:PTS system mannose/fructose/sorbose family transporter subunit IID n=1 Tax=Eiseniibacteriota bacterium TaxID=2212470 RepID=A0A832I2H4_UNCEI